MPPTCLVQGSPPGHHRPPRPPQAGTPPKPRVLGKRSTDQLLSSSTAPAAGCVQLNNRITACTARKVGPAAAALACQLAAHQLIGWEPVSTGLAPASALVGGESMVTPPMAWRRANVEQPASTSAEAGTWYL